MHNNITKSCAYLQKWSNLVESSVKCLGWRRFCHVPQFKSKRKFFTQSHETWFSLPNFEIFADWLKNWNVGLDWVSTRFSQMPQTSFGCVLQPSSRKKLLVHPQDLSIVFGLAGELGKELGFERFVNGSNFQVWGRVVWGENASDTFSVSYHIWNMICGTCSRLLLVPPPHRRTFRISGTWGFLLAWKACFLLMYSAWNRKFHM